MDETTITLELSVDDINLILEALGERPFKSVYGLVSRLQSQARAQLRTEGSAEDTRLAEPDANAAAVSEVTPAREWS
ncbi:MAG: hypothetical protein LW834_22590 [Cyanobium sp. 49614_E6]|jgi:hypothetical protein|nr:hypothetical protein [Cyanobium sp. 49614_E6]